MENKVDFFLADVFDERAQDPRHFVIPTEAEVRALKVGDEVKLIFVIDTSADVDNCHAERMWVKITDIDGDKFRGVLDNEPRFINTIGEGSAISFERRHIATVIVPSPEGLEDLSKFAFISRRALDKREINYACCDRSEVDNPQDSGWQFFYGDEESEYCDNPANVAIISLDDALSFEPLLEDALASGASEFFFDRDACRFVEVEE